jgi:hypothetical protein
VAGCGAGGGEVKPPFHARAEHATAYDLEASSDLERARRVWVLLSQGRGSTLRRTGWRFYRDPAGYDSPLYRRKLDNWTRVDVAAWTGNGIRDGATKTDGVRTEVLWSNRDITEPDLFGGVA